MSSYVSVEELDPARHSAPGSCPSIMPSLIKNWCDTELQWVAHEFHNAPRLWGQVARHVRGYLGVLWVTGALRGERPPEAFRVTCDQTTMTQTDIREGHVVCQVGIAPVKPSEFVFYRIRIRLQPLRKPLAVA